VRVVGTGECTGADHERLRMSLAIALVLGQNRSGDDFGYVAMSSVITTTGVSG